MTEERGTSSGATGGAVDVRPKLWMAGLHLFTLCGFAVARPLFEVLAGDATFFVARRTQAVDLFALVLATSVLLPLALLAIEWGVGLASLRLRAGLHTLFVFLLFAALLTAPLKRAGGAASEWPLWVALGSGVLLTVLYTRSRSLRSLLSVLAFAPLLFAGLFLLNPAVSKAIYRWSGEFPSFDVDAETTVVFVIFDELPLTSLMTRELEIDAGLFPNFHALAAESTWFRNATASHIITWGAVPAIVTGKVPHAEDGVPVARDHPLSVFTLLSGSHRMKVHETITRICPDPVAESGPEPASFGRRTRAFFDDLSVVYGHIVLPGSLGAGLPPVTDNWDDFRRTGQQRTDEERDKILERRQLDRTQAFEAFIDAIDTSVEPTLYFLHVAMPHSPWVRVPSGKHYSSVYAGKLGQTHGGKWLEAEALVALGYQRHLLQLGHADRLLGRLTERLKEQGVYDRSLLVVAADHGHIFRPGDHRRNPTPENVRDVLHIPMFFKAPGQREGRVDDRNMQSVDTLPTICDYLGFELPWESEGISVLGAEPAARPEKVIAAVRKAPIVVDGELPKSWRGLDDKLRWFGEPKNWDDVYRLGPRPTWVGEPLSAFQRADQEAVRARAQILEPQRYRDVDLDSSYLPCLIEGTIALAEGSAAPEAILLALHGVVRAVVPTYENDQGVLCFAGMIPDSAFRNGHNDIEVWAVLEGDEVALLPGLTYRLVEKDAAEPYLEDSDGVRYPIERRRVRGRVQSAVVDGGELRVEGWAVEAVDLQAADFILMVPAGSSTAFVSPTGDRRVKVAGALGGDMGTLHAGFEFVLPSSGGSTSAWAGARFFGVCNGVASELRFGPQAEWLAARGE